MDAMFARVISEARLSQLRSSDVHVEIDGRVEVGNGIVIDIEKLVVEKRREILL